MERKLISLQKLTPCTKLAKSGVTKNKASFKIYQPETRHIVDNQKMVRKRKEGFRKE